MSTAAIDAALVELTCELLPEADPTDLELFVDGQFHEVVLAPGIGAVRIARELERADELRRVSALCERLDAVGLPFAVPTPLGPVVEHDGRAALATAWIPR